MQTDDLRTLTGTAHWRSPLADDSYVSWLSGEFALTAAEAERHGYAVAGEVRVEVTTLRDGRLNSVRICDPMIVRDGELIPLCDITPEQWGEIEQRRDFGTAGV